MAEKSSLIGYAFYDVDEFDLRFIKTRKELLNFLKEKYNETHYAEYTYCTSDDFHILEIRRDKSTKFLDFEVTVKAHKTYEHEIVEVSNV